MKIDDKVILLPSGSSRLIEVMRAFMAKEKLGVYITFAEKHQHVKEWLRTLSIDTNYLFFIDPIAKSPDDVNVFIVDAPEDLTEISIVLTEVLSDDEFGYVVIDDIDSLRLSNGLDNAKNFIDVVARFVKKNKKALILTYDEHEEGEEHEVLMDFCKSLSDVDLK